MQIGQDNSNANPDIYSSSESLSDFGDSGVSMSEDSNLKSMNVSSQWSCEVENKEYQNFNVWEYF